MSNKIKSLIYLGCFILTAIIYQKAGVASEAEMLTDKSEITEAHATTDTYSDDIELTRKK